MITTESLFRGRLKIRQRKKGYRFSVDTAILAHHVDLKDTDTAVDLGAGCGIISIILAHRVPSAHLYGIEIQRDLAELAAANVRLNDMEDRITIVHQDMRNFRSYLRPGGADVVFSNPPYRRFLAGRVCPDRERAVARHEITVSLSDVISVAGKLLRPSGRLFVIYPAERATDLITQMRAFKLEPKRLRLVHSREHSEAELVLAEGSKHGKPGVKVSPPLVVHKRDGSYTDEVKKMISF
ncbi:MAG: tRNA1(Val) (adenine(37)-N6)-methyltransferase [Deltaproteobacteria bacterium]|nr:tRNA1(Val) (adenine(37)-N6)-methyltransferase [Deltaproteobacteria bacterium]